MRNKAMERKLDSGEAIDVSHFPQDGGDYVITGHFKEETDYCVVAEDDSIRSIGVRKSDGAVLASTSSKFYQNADYDCIWLR